MKKLLLAIVFITTFISCREKSLAPDQNPETDFNLTNVDPKVENGYLAFRSPDELAAVIENMQSSAGHDLLDRVKTKTGFKSYKEYRLENSRTVVNDKVLKMREVMNNPNIAIVKQSVKDLPPTMEPLVNQDGLVRIGSTMLQFTHEYVKELQEFNGTTEQLALLINATPSNKGAVKFHAIYSDVNKISGYSNSRIGPYSESVIGGPLPIAFVGSVFVYGYLTCYALPTRGGVNWYLDAEARAYTDAEDELTGVQATIQVTSTTHTSTSVSGTTRHYYQLQSSRGFYNDNRDFKGEVKYYITMYPYGYTLYSVGSIYITN